MADSSFEQIALMALATVCGRCFRCTGNTGGEFCRMAVPVWGTRMQILGSWVGGA